jgi:hypothetical protein
LQQQSYGKSHKIHGQGLCRTSFVEVPHKINSRRLALRGL